MADARDSKSRGVDPPWGFKSPLRHHAFFRRLCDRQIANRLGFTPQPMVITVIVVACVTANRTMIGQQMFCTSKNLRKINELPYFPFHWTWRMPHCDYVHFA
jgi:hypothetical protein